MPTRKSPPPPSPTSPSMINGGFAAARSLSLPPSAGGRQVLPTLQQQNSNNHHHHHHRRGSVKPTKIFRRVRSVFKSLPIMTTPCKMPNMPTIGSGGGGRHDGHHNIHGGKQMTGTLFGYRKCRVNLALQESPRSLPILILELSINTGKLLHDMGIGLVRIALECEKRHPSEKIKLVDEPVWTMYCNGRKVGYAVKREPTDEDLHVIQLLQAVSMGAGVLPSGGDIDRNASSSDGGSGELTYLRSCFERVVGSKDSETYYMMNVDSSSGPELSIFFVRV